MRSPVLSALFFLAALVCLDVAADASGTSVRIGRTGGISADFVDAPLAQALSDLAKAAAVEVRGTVDGDQRVTASFSGVTPEEAIRKVLAGYNYVLVRPEGPGGKATLTVIGKSERRPADPPASPPGREAEGGLGHTGPAIPASTQPGSAAQPPAAPVLPPVPPAQPPAGEQGQTRQAQGQAPAVEPPPVPTTALPRVGLGGGPPGPFSAETPPGILPPPESQPPFNPAAWGGRGRRR